MLQHLEIPYINRAFGQEQFHIIAAKSGAVYLDSSSYSEQQDAANARFDIFSAFPYQVISLNESSFSIDGKEVDNGEDAKDVFTYINQQLSSVSIELPEAIRHIPFAGGAIGYFSYDLGRKIEKLPTLAKDDIEMPMMELGLYNWAVIRDHKLEKAWLIYFHDVTNINEKHISFEKLKQLFVTEKFEKAQMNPNFHLSSDWISEMSKAEYRDKFARVHEYILAGDCYQINLAQRFSACYQGDEWQAYRTLSQANNAPFSAFIRTQDSVILSISPERFIQAVDRQLTTEPIKGTRPRFTEAAQDQQSIEALQSSEKDKAENLMIVDLLRNDLSRSSVAGTVKVPKLFEVKSYSAVHHLVSKVTATLLPNKTPLDALIAAFPGGSITGAPKVRAMEIIEELEPVRRNIYCGSIGYIDYRGNMDTSITIRTLIAKNHKLYCWAGGGLVADSKVDEEYQECFDKINKILPVLAKTK